MTLVGIVGHFFVEVVGQKRCRGGSRETRYYQRVPSSQYASIQDRKEVKMTAYCMKCKRTREIKTPTRVTMSNGRNAVRGSCPTCGTKMFKFVK